MELFKLLGTIAVENGDANKAIDETTGKAEKSSNKMVDAFKKIGAAVAAAFAIDKIKDFGVAIVQASAEVAAEEAAFTQIMGEYTDQATEKIEKIADATGMVSSRLTPYMTSMTAKFKGLGYDVEEATNLASTGLNIAADAAAFWDKSLDDSMSALNSFVNGNYEGGEAIGLFANETTLAAWSAENLGFEWNELTEKEKQFARLEFAKAMQQASGATGQASKEADAYANVQGNLNEAWRQFKAQIGEPLLQNVVIPAMKWLGDFIGNTLSPAFEVLKVKLKELYNWFNENKEAIKNVVAVIGVLITTWGAFKIGSAIQSMITGFQNAKLQVALYSLEVGKANLVQGALNGKLTIGQTAVALLTGKIKLSTLATNLWSTAQTKLNVAMSANPIGIVVAAIAALIAIFVVAYNKSETFRAIVDKLWATIKEKLIKVFEQLKPYIEQAIEVLGKLWEIVQNNLIKVFEELSPYINEVINALSELWEELVAQILPVLMEVYDAILELWTQLQPVFAELIETVKSIFAMVLLLWEELKPVLMEILDIVMVLFGDILDVIMDVMPFIIETIKSALTVIKNIINVITALIKGDWDGVWEGIKNTFITYWEYIKTAGVAIWEFMKGIFTAVWKALEPIFSGIWNGIKNTAINIWDGIKNFFVNTWNGIKTTASNVWNKLSDAITTPIRNARDKIKEYVDKIKEFFGSFKTNIKLPHFKIENASWNPKDWIEKGVPKLKVEWYKDGGIMNEPTVFDYNPATRTARVGGEAGAEAIAPLDTLMGYIETAVENKTSGMSEILYQIVDVLNAFFPQIISMANKQIVLDSGVLVGELAPAMDAELGDIYTGKGRGR